VRNFERDAGAYTAGEYTAVVVDVATTGGSKTLTKAAAKTTLKQLRKDRRIARKVLDLSKGDNLFAHHVNPLKGHPGGAPTMFPTAGLPSFIRNSPLNLKALDHAAHMADHQRLRLFENLARGMGIANPYVTTARAAFVVIPDIK